ncbi:gluconokinase [Rhodococcus sp. UYP5]
MTDSTGGAHPVLVIMGVSGSGKSTVAGVLARALSWDFQEGDDLHPASNVAKMASGVPLTDEDRLPWLNTIADWIRSHTRRGEPGIVTCSALKRSYRDVLAHGSEGQVLFVHLVGTKTQLGDRLDVRSDHFMPSGLLDSQLSTLEPIGPDENALLVDVGPPPQEIAARIIAELDSRQGE